VSCFEEVAQGRQEFCIRRFDLAGICRPLPVGIMYKRERRRTGDYYSGIIDRKNVKLSRLLLVSERDWRKQPAEAGGLRRPKKWPGEISTISQAPSSTRRFAQRHLEQPDSPKGSPVLHEICLGYRQDWALVFGRSKQVADNAGGVFTF
jgi:hypothetical protein